MSVPAASKKRNLMGSVPCTPHPSPKVGPRPLKRDSSAIADGELLACRHIEGITFQQVGGRGEHPWVDDRRAVFGEHDVVREVDRRMNERAVGLRQQN